MEQATFVKKMKKLALSFGLALLTLSVKSQNVDFEWARSIKGTDSDRVASIAVDDLGNLYAVGIFRDTILDANNSPLITSHGSFDIYVQKTDTDGNVLWSKSFGGIGYDFVSTIKVDHSGNIIITGNFVDTVDFDPGAGTFDIASHGTRDVYVLKLDTNGDFIWAKSIGGIGYESSTSMELDAADNIYFGGTFQDGADFDPTSGVINQPFEGGFYDCFIEKLDTDGEFVWVKTMGGTEQDNLEDIAIDHQGNIYAIGEFGDTVDFDPGANTTSLISVENRNLFIQKLDENGNFIWAKAIEGTTGYGTASSLVIDGLENVYLTGYFYDTLDFDPGMDVMYLVSSNSASGNSDIFIEKLDNNGDFVWAKAMAGTGSEYANSIDLDNLGAIYLGITFSDTLDADLGTGIDQFISNGNGDVLVEKMDTNGNFLWAKSIGGHGSDYISDFEMDTYGNIYFGGAFNDTVDFDPGTNVFNLTAITGNRDSYIMKLSGTNSAAITDFTNETNTNITMYPNPTNGIVTIDFGQNNLTQTNLQLIDVLGKVVYNGPVTSQLTTLNLNGYSNGVYIIQFSNQEERQTYKLVKE